MTGASHMFQRGERAEMPSDYARVSDDLESVGLSNTHPRPSRTRSSTSSDESDVSYRDNLEDEPFSEKDKRFTDEPMMEDGEEGYIVESRRLRPRKKSRKVLAVLLGIIGIAAGIGILAGLGYSTPVVIKSGNKHITLDHVFNGTFRVDSVGINWVKEAPDGTYSEVDKEHNIILKNVYNTSNSEVLVNATNVKDESGNTLHWTGWSLSADKEFVLFQTDYLKQWRHSSHANYWVHQLSDSSTFPIIPPTSPPAISKILWAPVGHSLSYVKENDLYVVSGHELGQESNAVRVTTDGSAVVFNGVPDWVYEEEVFETDSTTWWSPDGTTIAYLRMNESEVKDYRLQFYNPSSDAFEPHQYTSELDMKYPKPGTPNPLVTIHTFSLSSYLSSHIVETSKSDLTWPGQMDQDERIIREVSWISDDGLIVKEVDRASRLGNVVLFQDGQNVGKVVRKLGKDGEEGDDGWIDHGQNVRPLKGAALEGYVDIVPNEGFNHLAYFSPLDSSTPIWLTSGEWEVTNIVGLDAAKGLIYFIGANPSIDRHVYSASLPLSTTEVYEAKPTALTDTSVPGYFDVSFSPQAGFYLLSYRGPDIPYQRLIEAKEDGVNELLESNDRLNATLSEFMRPIVTRTTIESDGHQLNMLEILPPGIDTSGRKRYPVLIRVYGGPGSQMVSNRFERDWHTYLACEKKYVIVMVDGRGTGFKGRKLRNPVIDNLGNWEVADQIRAASEMAKREYIDRQRIGIWGWSYGGYMTLKTLEADSGVFTLGMAVAPVTNWLYYDSIYTERYMSTPTVNPEGYISSAVNNVTAFGKVDFLWAHGSGDDNVHYSHTASLLDKLTQKHVRGWRFRMFTDSNHSMDKREAYRELHEWMTAFLEEKWGRGGTIRHG